MNKKISLEKTNEAVNILMDNNKILEIELSKNKINGKELFENLDVNSDDVFELESIKENEDSKLIDDVVLKNTHIFIEKVIQRINDTLEEIRTNKNN